MLLRIVRCQEPKKNSLSLLDRAADRAAELIAFQGVLLGAEEIARVQLAVAEEFESRAVDRVGRRTSSRC